jgi:hypothetical protein
MMTDRPEGLVTRLHREAVERLRGAPLPPPEPPPINLPEQPVDATFAAEWRLFRQAVARLLAEGQKGRFALVKAGHELTVWDTLRDAAEAARLLFGPAPCLVQEVQPSLRPRHAAVAASREGPSIAKPIIRNSLPGALGAQEPEPAEHHHQLDAGGERLGSAALGPGEPLTLKSRHGPNVR